MEQTNKFFGIEYAVTEEEYIDSIYEELMELREIPRGVITRGALKSYLKLPEYMICKLSVMDIGDFVYFEKHKIARISNRLYTTAIK